MRLKENKRDTKLVAVRAMSNIPFCAEYLNFD